VSPSAPGLPPWPALRFDPRAEVRVLAVAGRPLCHVVDGALANPGEWRDFAIAARAAFAARPGNAFPGPELALPGAVAAELGAWFHERFRHAFGVRRLRHRQARLSMVVRPPEALQPWQCLPHIDRLDLGPGECAIASVLYLFHDESLGGTAFYRPARSPEAVFALLGEAAREDPEAFHARHGLPRAYPLDSNAWFEKVASVPARFNRLLFYPGTVFHSGEIRHPERLDEDPASGRLTLNGFFVGRRRAGA